MLILLAFYSKITRKGGLNPMFALGFYFPKNEKIDVQSAYFAQMSPDGLNAPIFLNFVC